MSWTAIVPLKAPADRKTRLAACLSARERDALSRAMAAHVIATLRAVPEVGRVLLLSPQREDGVDAAWEPDLGTGLNRELARVRAGCGERVLILHADLPLLASGDVAALLDAAQTSGAAIAPDRHGSGTNALALGDARPFRFAFGPASFACHTAEQPCAVVRRPGLALDVDTPEDVARLRQIGACDRWLGTAGTGRHEQRG